MRKYIAAALMIVVLAGAATVLASENIWGRVEKVDTAQNTISAWNGQLGKFTIKVDSATKITKDGNQIQLGDLKVGNHIEGAATKQSDGVYLGENLAVTLNRNGNQTCNGLGGRIQSVDAVTRTITMFSGRLGEYKVTVNADAKITLDGKDAKLEDLKADQMAWFEATENADGTYTASSVEARENAGRGGRGGCRGGNGGGCRGRGGN
jgi:hypothetical protein